MRQDLTQGIANSAVTLATSTGILTSVLAFLDSNAAGIGAGSTIIFGCIYVYFQWSSNKKLTIAEVNTIEIDNLRGETAAGFAKVDNSISKLDKTLELISNKLG